MGRRIAALFVDWLIAYGLAALAMSVGIGTMATLSTAVLIVWFVLGAVSVRLFGFTPGQFALGLLVVPVDGRQHVGLGRALVRGVLIAVVIPALITDSDMRGFRTRRRTPRSSGDERLREWALLAAWPTRPKGRTAAGLAPPDGPLHVAHLRL